MRAAQQARAGSGHIGFGGLYPYAGFDSPRHHGHGSGNSIGSAASYRGRDYAEYAVHAREAYDPTTYGYDDVSPSASASASASRFGATRIGGRGGNANVAENIGRLA